MPASFLKHPAVTSGVLASLVICFAAGRNSAASNPQFGPPPSPERYVGQIIMVPYQFAPSGWVDCDGRELNISEHVALFSLIGTTYGGDGRTTFAVPDLRDRCPVGIGTPPGGNHIHLATKRGGDAVAADPHSDVSTQRSLSVRYIIATKGEFPSRQKP